jgi:hypothetical protein
MALDKIDTTDKYKSLIFKLSNVDLSVSNNNDLKKWIFIMAVTWLIQKS